MIHDDLKAREKPDLPQKPKTYMLQGVTKSSVQIKRERIFRLVAVPYSRFNVIEISGLRLVCPATLIRYICRLRASLSLFS